MDPTPPDTHRERHRRQALARLRAQIRALQGGCRTTDRLPLGQGAIDQALNGGLAAGALHAVEATAGGFGGSDGREGGTGFCALLLARIAARRTGALMWIFRRPARSTLDHRTGVTGGLDRLGGDLYAPGLVQLGLPLDRLVAVATAGREDAAWAAEEALRCPDMAAVVVELDGLTAGTGRRLQLAAETGGGFGFLLARDDRASAIPSRDAARAACPADRSGRRFPIAATRWRVGQAAPVDTDGTGRIPDPIAADGPIWAISLLKCRDGRPGAWVVEVCNATGDFRLASESGSGTPSVFPDASGPKGVRTPDEPSRSHSPSACAAA